MTEYEILYLWQELDSGLLETMSIFMAATFAVVTAAYAAGSRMSRLLAGFMMIGYSYLSFLVTAYFWNNVLRIGALSQTYEAMGENSGRSLADPSVYLFVVQGAYASLAVFFLIWLSALIAVFWLRRRTTD